MYVKNDVNNTCKNVVLKGPKKRFIINVNIVWQFAKTVKAYSVKLLLGMIDYQILFSLSSITSKARNIDKNRQKWYNRSARTIA